MAGVGAFSVQISTDNGQNYHHVEDSPFQLVVIPDVAAASASSLVLSDINVLRN